ncbi:hypothetical protein GCM10010169_42760 [Micromonospora fulviviridis]|uniref:DUF4012 domain-containing protein n=1 Tax=Micromonospora fulviviridis TaxID=47860 RepID=UPI00166A1C92|nr:DUF4012 domain-containing protein [Micromonospora fulviviridis]GGR93790.1 hypothetical protein GCM10010169_42760 [Micromonospora fulviviridis]
MTESGGPPRRRRRSRRRSRARVRRVLLVGLVVVSVLLAGGGWVGFRGWQARAHLLNAAGLAQELSTLVVGGDVARAQRTLAALQEQAAAARGATGDPGWWLGQQAPYAGDDLAAVRQIAVAVDDLARLAFPTLLRVDLASLVPKEGRLDLGRLRAVSAEVSAADRAVRQTGARLRAVSTEDLVEQVRDAVAGLRTELDRLGELTAAADQGARLLPALLGADGPRSYLLVSQNPAELRATGGMFGAHAVLRAEGGRIRMSGQASASSLRSFTPPLPVSQEMRRLWKDLPGTFPADVNLSPDFPTAAALYREMVRRRTGTAVDGVLAVDPLVLSYLLGVLGPVTVPGRPSLAGSSVVRTLLSDTYRTLDTKAQDTYFAQAASAVFDALFSRAVNPRALLTVFNRSITERRILFWSVHPAEQSVLGDSQLSGKLREKDTVPTVGVFLNDGSGAKLGYYLRFSATVTVGDCQPDGRRELRLRVTVHSTAPQSGLAESVTGLALSGDPYTARTFVSVYTPTGGAVLGGRLDGRDTAMGSGTAGSRQVTVANVEVKPGRTRTLDVALLTGKTSAGTAELVLTPTVTPWTTQVVSAPSCDQ